MIRTILRLSLAILAFAALSGCMIERLTGPNLDPSLTQRDGAGALSDRPREDDPPPPVADPTREGIEVGSDTLRAGEDR